MREFDLEQALAGAPVCTRDGRPVTQLVKFDCKYEYRVFGVVDGAPASWMESGQHTFYKDHPCDLFMAPTKKPDGWLGIPMQMGDRMLAELFMIAKK